MLGTQPNSRVFSARGNSTLLTPRNIVIAVAGLCVLYFVATLSGPASLHTKSPLSGSGADSRIVIIGSGVTGLGAAYRLYELDHADWDVYEMGSDAGGLATSVDDPEGFTWDVGVHVLFSHFGYFDSLLDYALPIDEWQYHTRSSPIYMRDRFVGYPLQNNIWRLPAEDLEKCLDGLLAVHDAAVRGDNIPKPKNFEEWMVQSFGQGIVDIFMSPYNFKVWAHPPKEMNSQWVGERVATIDLSKILSNMVNHYDAIHWGPNARFRYPSRGAGHVWDNVFRLLPRERFHFNHKVVEINVDNPNHKFLVFSDGSKTNFDALVSTIPMDKMLRLIANRADLHALADDPESFKRQTCNLVGIGVQGPVPTGYGPPGSLRSGWNDSHWVYFPEDVYPFYRLTVLTNFSPYLVPKPGNQYSVLVEVSESKYRPVDQNTVVDDVIEGLRHAGILAHDANIVTKWNERFDYGYPVPYVDLDEHTFAANDQLLPLGIWSRGRFGWWHYVVGNQDHSMMQGVHAVDNILFGEGDVGYEEMIYEPNAVNGRKGTRKILKPKHAEFFDLVIPGCSHSNVPSWLGPMLDELNAATIKTRVFIYASCPHKKMHITDTFAEKYNVRIIKPKANPVTHTFVPIYLQHITDEYDDLASVTFFLPGATTNEVDSLTHPAAEDTDLTSEWDSRPAYVYSTSPAIDDNNLCALFDAMFAYDGTECPSNLPSASVFHISRGSMFHLQPHHYRKLTKTIG